MNLVQSLVIVHWLHLAAMMVLLGSALYPSYAPTGRYLDRPLRLVMRVAAFCALATALAETGVTTRSLPRLALLAFAGLISVSLRRNSWTALTQARALATTTAVALCAEPLAVGPDRPPISMALEAIELIATGVWCGGLVPLFIVIARSANWFAIARVAVGRAFVVAACASGLLLITGTAETIARLAPPADLRLGAIRAGLIGSLLALAAIDRFVLTGRMRGEGSARPTLTASIGIQLLLTFLLVGTIAVHWAQATGH